jgi:hypothetical protein
MQDNRIPSLVVSLILILVISSACQPAQPAAPASTDAVPVVAAVQRTATTAPPSATPPPTETPAPTETSTPTETAVPMATATITPTEGLALNPSPRGYVSMAYDSESDKIILFGGQIEGRGPVANGETWAYDIASNTWTEMKPAISPYEKGALDLVYDSESDRVILFGGNWGEKDTWAYDYNTNTWTEMAEGPADRLGYRAAYDAESDRYILFGGANFSGYPVFYKDTWAYDFNTDTWTEMEPVKRPYARNYHAMAYDAQADRIILFGGGHIQDNMGDTWVYDFNLDTWTKIEPNGGIRPGSRSYHAMVYDPASNKTILFGGNLDGDETWTYDYSTSTWTKLDPNLNPGVLYKHAMAYSTAAGLVVLFGGQPTEANFDYEDHTWVYDPKATTWTDVTRSP